LDILYQISVYNLHIIPCTKSKHDKNIVEQNTLRICKNYCTETLHGGCSYSGGKPQRFVKWMQNASIFLDRVFLFYMSWTTEIRI